MNIIINVRYPPELRGGLHKPRKLFQVSLCQQTQWTPARLKGLARKSLRRNGEKRPPLGIGDCEPIRWDSNKTAPAGLTAIESPESENSEQSLLKWKIKIRRGKVVSILKASEISSKVGVSPTHGVPILQQGADRPWRQEYHEGVSVSHSLNKIRMRYKSKFEYAF